jgi:hypothetical protein
MISEVIGEEQQPFKGCHLVGFLCVSICSDLEHDITHSAVGIGD